MNSFIYIYSKFTEEFLLLGAAGIFALLSVYCYHWVIQKRRMGVARSQIPSAVVKAYLGQLINEAEFVRKQLFGMTDGSSTANAPSMGSFANFNVAAENSGNTGNTAINPDLMARVNSLESQLRDKESLVVNINVEKNKLLQEIENLKLNSGSSAASSSNQNQLLDKIKHLEARLEEYSLFEEDLANLKRLQQENADLKKKLTDAGGAAPKAAAPAVAPATAPAASVEPAVERKPLAAVPTPEPEPEPAAEQKHALDQNAIDALLNGKPATPPVTEAPKPALQAVPAEPVAQPEPAAPAVSALPSIDQFEKLVDSVETSLDAGAANIPEPIAEPAAPAATAAPAPVTAAAPMEAASTDDSSANKTDEELLKEFENLLNS